jgi:hypothetical protein
MKEFHFHANMTVAGLVLRQEIMTMDSLVPICPDAEEIGP